MMGAFDWRIDIGGTFTDLVALDARGVGRFVHGTTIVINALTERRGAKVALIATPGSTLRRTWN